MEEERQLSGERSWYIIERLLLALTFGCFALMALVMAGVSLVHLPEGSSPGSVVICLALPCLGMAAVAVLCRRAWAGSARRFALVLFLAVLAGKGIFAAAVDTRPISDFAVLYDAAVRLAQGGVSLSGEHYFDMWPYQSGFVAYMAVLIRLFGANVLFLKLTNALYAALTSVAVYALARRFASEEGARGAALLYTLYPGTWLLLPVLTNQHLAELLFALALYLYTTPGRGLKKRLGLAGAAGAVLALANAIRPVAIVALAAGGCLMVLEMLRERKSGLRGVRDALVRLILFAAVYAVVMWGLGGLVRAAGIHEDGLVSNCPEWKFVCGLNEQTRGGYSGSDEAWVFGSENPRETAREIALERIKIPLNQLLALFGNKISDLWGKFEPTAWAMTENVAEQIDASPLPVSAEQVKQGFERLACGSYTLCFLLIALGGAAALRGDSRKAETARMLALVALAYFGVHLFIEIQTRYRSLMYVAAFPLAAVGLDALWALWDGRRAGRKDPQNI